MHILEESWYQELLVEYLLENSEEGKIGLPISTRLNKDEMRNDAFGFYHFLKARGAIKEGETYETDVQKAIKGVLGMMRFGNYDSPILLEVLGDLLMHKGAYSSARQLAARAYLKASYEVDDMAVQRFYRVKALQVLFVQRNNMDDVSYTLFLEELEEQLQEEINDANAFYSQIQEDEFNWIVTNTDVDQKFASKYFNEPKSIDAPLNSRRNRRGRVMVFYE